MTGPSKSSRTQLPKQDGYENTIAKSFNTEYSENTGGHSENETEGKGSNRSIRDDEKRMIEAPRGSDAA